MWQSEDDIVRDLVFLNDFGTPDKEPFRVFCSIGRGTKNKGKQKSSEEFIDTRTGEVICSEDSILNDNNEVLLKGKGRGSFLASYSKSQYQLQQQLRLARPLGSSDEAVESYYRKNKPSEVVENSNDSSDFKTDSQSLTGTNEKDNIDSKKTKERVKATRNSKFQSNALISSLLSNTKEKLNSSLQVEYQSLNSNVEKLSAQNDFYIKDKTINDNNTITQYSSNNNKNSNGSSDKKVNNHCIENNTSFTSDENAKSIKNKGSKNYQNGSNLGNKFLLPKTNDFVLSWIKKCDGQEESTEQNSILQRKNFMENENFKINDDDTDEDENISNVKNNCSTKLSDFDNAAQKNLKYKKLGEKLCDLYDIDSKTSEKLYSYIKVNSNSGVNPSVLEESKTGYVFNDKDFPALQRN